MKRFFVALTAVFAVLTGSSALVAHARCCGTEKVVTHKKKGCCPQKKSCQTNTCKRNNCQRCTRTA